MPYKKWAHPANKKLHNSALYHRTPPYRKLPANMQTEYPTYDRDHAFYYLWKTQFATLKKLAAESGMCQEGVRKSIKRYAKKIYQANIAESNREEKRIERKRQRERDISAQ